MSAITPFDVVTLSTALSETAPCGDNLEYDPQFLAVVNETLGDLYRSGEINGIYQRWFESPIPPKGLNLEFPMTSELKAIIAKPVSDPVQ